MERPEGTRPCGTPHPPAEGDMATAGELSPRSTRRGRGRAEHRIEPRRGRGAVTPGAIHAERPEGAGPWWYRQ